MCRNVQYGGNYSNSYNRKDKFRILSTGMFQALLKESWTLEDVQQQELDSTPLLMLLITLTWYWPRPSAGFWSC